MGQRRYMAARMALAAWMALTIASARPASAFCGFYVSGADATLTNHATQVVLMRDGIRTVLSMQNNYEGPPENFAMVVPVPVVLHKENVKTLSRDIFDRVDRLTAPRLVEYWEQDPCSPPIAPGARFMSLRGAGVGAGAGPFMQREAAVRIEAQFEVGEYDVVVLSATESSALDAWLRQNGYRIPAGAEPYLRPYVQMGMKFFVAKVDVSKVHFERTGNGPEQAMLSPLRFHYDSDAFALPIRLGLINSNGTQDLVVTIFAPGTRYEVANYDNVAIPTNLDVSDATRDEFASFYAKLFDETVQRHPRSVVTEYSWSAYSCDPCPTPPLSGGDLSTLGSDVLWSTPAPVPSGGGAPIVAPPQVVRPHSSNFVVTRLHARYSKTALGDDLVFREAPPIVGGREFLQADGKIEQAARPDANNTFQARYVIRHPWTGPIACSSPRRGLWGGPPGGIPSAPPRSAARVGLVPRGSVTLASFLREPIFHETLLAAGGRTPALLAVTAGGATADAAGPGEVDAAGPPRAAEDTAAGSTPRGASNASTGAPLPGTSTPPRSGCSTGGPGGSTDAAWVFVLGAAIAARLRRRNGQRHPVGPAQSRHLCARGHP